MQYANFMFKNELVRDETELEPASLMNVDFSGADLTKALISSRQLLGTRSLSGTILPNGQMFEEWKKNHSLKDGTNFEADNLRIFENIHDILQEEKYKTS